MTVESLQPTKPGRVGRFLPVLLALFVGACAAIYTNHGYVPPEDVLAGIRVGVSDREEVARLAGRPSTAGVITDRAWYYVASKRRHYAWKAPEEIDRQVVRISFDDRGTVRNIERFTLADGRVVRLNARVTETGIRGIGLLRQLLSNIGRTRLTKEDLR